MKTNTSLPRSARGQSLVEFAISLTAILILLAGAVDFGIGLFHYVAMRDAAQEGALFGSMNPDNNAGIVDRVANASGDTGIIQKMIDEGMTINVTYDPNNPVGDRCEGDSITVSLAYDYQISMPFIGMFTGDTIRLRAAVTDTILTPFC
jgi:Flp pilus assembly protein TadG